MQGQQNTKKGGDLIHPTQKRDKGQAFVNKVMKFGVPEIQASYLLAEDITFSERNLLFMELITSVTDFSKRTFPTEVSVTACKLH